MAMISAGLNSVSATVVSFRRIGLLTDIRLASNAVPLRCLTRQCCPELRCGQGVRLMFNPRDVTLSDMPPESVRECNVIAAYVRAVVSARFRIEVVMFSDAGDFVAWLEKKAAVRLRLRVGLRLNAMVRAIDMRVDPISASEERCVS